jgi:NAD(P)-dependent dehydrogenase (short-subunit alcohol dehydrogenase family)
VHYVRNAANELSRYGITANYINADAIDTPLFRALVQERATASGQTEDAVLQRYADRSIFRTASRRRGRPLAGQRPQRPHQRLRDHRRRRRRGLPAVRDQPILYSLEWGNK